MPDNTSIKSDALHQVKDTEVGNTVTLRVPKPNVQVAVLGLVALITLFQTVQLVRIGAKVNSAPAKAAPAATTTTTTGGSGSNSDVPQSMVGGC